MSVPWKKNPKSLQKAIDYRFKREQLLVEALCHRSFTNENKELNFQHNERLEFLGDSILGFIVAGMLIRRFPEASEGWLTKVRAALVKSESLARFAKQVDLSDYALLGRGEEKSEGRNKERMNADLFEALLGAIYLDSGIRACEQLVKPLMIQRIEEDGLEDFDRDYKSQLQERTMKRWGKLPRYLLEKCDGPEHQKRFHVSVWLKEDRLGRGIGRSKKQSQQLAAKDAIAFLKRNNPSS